MKRMFTLLLGVLLALGLSGCDLFNPDDVCPDGYIFDEDAGECVEDVDPTDNQAPTITLNGPASITISVGTAYNDAGATANDPEDGDLTADIVVVNPVNTAVAGNYTITYNVSDSEGLAAQQVTRTVIVQEEAVNNLPTITLNGAATITITVGDAYNDLGATASDVEDGDLTSSIVVVNNVNPMVAGNYTVTYNVTDGNGGAATQVTRTVIVLPSDAQLIAELIVDSFETSGDIQFLALTMANMDFSQAMTLTTDFYMEISEDVDETHYISAIVEDSYLYDELGDSMQRVVTLDVDGEQTIELTVIFEEVATGVHVYIHYAPIIDLITMQDPEVADMIGYVGFDDEWALFQFDDSLQNIIEIQVLKDMLVSLFFSEVGEMFFYQLQDELEAQIGFDLNQYGVEFGQFIDYLIEEDFDSAELLLQGIDVDGIVLRLDHMYVAYQLRQFFLMYETELTTAGFDITRLDLLDTATYDELNDVWNVNLPIDPLEGSQAFFDSLSETELDTLIEVAIKPFIEGMVFEGLTSDITPEWLDNDLGAILQGDQQFFIDNWPEASGAWDQAAELADLASLGAVEYWKQLTQEERDVIRWSLDMNHHGWTVWSLREIYENEWDYQWMIRRYEHFYENEWITGDLNDLIVNLETYLLNTHGVVANDWLTELNDMGGIDWYLSLDQTSRDIMIDLAQQPGYEQWAWAVWDMEMAANDPWQYQWRFTDGRHWLDEGWIHGDLVQLINNHSTYLMDEYGIDGSALIAEIDMYGAIDWYFFQASGDVKDALDEISRFNDYELRWVIDELQMVEERLDQYFWRFGRPEELYDFYWLNNELDWLLYFNQDYLQTTYGVDVDAWRADIMYGGALQWYGNLNETERGYVDEISQFEPMDYRWPVEVLQQLNTGEGEFGICLGNWDMCLEDQWATEDLVGLINQHSDWLTNDYGYDVPALISDIEMYGAIDWYLYYATEWDREVLDELARASEWPYEVLWTLEDALWQEQDLLDFLTVHQSELDAIGFDATQKIADLQMYGIQVFMNDYLTPDDIAILMDEYVYPKIDGLIDAINTNEVPEYLLSTFFTDPHVIAVLDSLDPTPEFDPFDLILIDDLAANMMAVDFDALALETVDMEALLTAVYEGQTAYDTFLTNIELTAPNSVLILELFSPAVDTIQPFMIYVDDINYAFEGLSVFEHYLDMSYWMQGNMMDVDVEATDDWWILTTMQMDSISYQLLVEDIFADINTYLSGFETLPFPFDENWDCIDPLDTECSDISDDINNINAILTQLGTIDMHALYDPSDPTWMQLGLDLTDFADVIVSGAYDDFLDDNPGYVPNNQDDIWTGVNELSITITMDSEGIITIPATADVDNANEIAQDLGKFAVSMFARDFLRELVWYYGQNPSEIADLTQTSYTLAEFDHIIRLSAAFDHELSTIGVTINPLDPTNPQFNLTLYWIDGTEALSGTVSLTDFQSNFDEFNELTSAAAFQAMVGYVNDDNFHMSKLFLMLMLQEEEEYYPEY